MTQQAQAEALSAIIYDLKESHKRTTHGTWGKGATSHETVSTGGREDSYKIADFRHADDAQFCDTAHALVPRLIEEVERLYARVQELEGQQTVPQGWKLVPVEPTLGMLNAGLGICALNGKPLQHLIDSATEKYTAMLAAAPTPPAQEK